jgi:hypothetical protein
MRPLSGPKITTLLAAGLIGPPLVDGQWTQIGTDAEIAAALEAHCERVGGRTKRQAGGMSEIAARRVALGMTQLSAAKAVGRSISWLRLVEDGKIAGSAGVVALIALYKAREAGR